MIVRLATRVMQLDHLASDVQTQPLSERHLGLGRVIGQEMPSAHRARQPLARGLSELAVIDDQVPAIGQAVARKAGPDILLCHETRPPGTVPRSVVHERARAAATAAARTRIGWITCLIFIRGGYRQANMRSARPGCPAR